MSSSATPRSGPDASSDTISVLVVDDERDCRDALKLAVQCLGYSCSVARDGVEAWEIYEAEGADVVLSDWKMPRMDGLALCKKVREADSGSPYTPFIFVTGNDDKAHFLEAMRAGADDYLEKPVDFDKLQTRLAAAARIVTLERRLRERNSSSF